MSPALVAVGELLAEASRAASAYDGPKLERLVGSLCDTVASYESQDLLDAEELAVIRAKLVSFVDLCHGLHNTLLGVMERVLAGAQPPTYAHALGPRKLRPNFLTNSFGYLRRYG